MCNSGFKRVVKCAILAMMFFVVAFAGGQTTGADERGVCG